MCFSPAAKCKTVYIAYKDKWNKRETSLFLKLATGVKQRACGDWHIQRVSCQSCAQSISSSQSVLFVCWICFGTCRPLIDMGAGAGKTLLWCEANNGPSVTPPQMFGLRGYTGVIMVQKSGHSLSCSHSLSSCSLFTCSCYSKTFSFVFFTLKLSFNSPPGLLTVCTDLLHAFLSCSASTFTCFSRTRSVSKFPSWPNFVSWFCEVQEAVSFFKGTLRQ